VQRGAEVRAGDVLYSLEQDSERAAREEAVRRLEAAQAHLSNLRKGRRPQEIAALEAQLAQARAVLRLAQAQLAREEKLAAERFISPERLDQARTQRDQNEARVREIEAQLAVARLGAREDEIRAARAEVEAAQAVLAQAEWRLAQKSVHAPVSGRVEDTYYVLGEWVNAGSPVVSLLPPGNVKIRFFVPETLLARIRSGQRVRVSCDGCRAMPAFVRYVSSQAEYTPPVIYSKDNRSKLVYLVEAWPQEADAAFLHPGQPVDVWLE
jgi:HlyD family secretion protein